MRRWLSVTVVVVVSLASLAAVAGGWWLFAVHRDDASLAAVGRLAADESLQDPARIARGRYLVTLGDCAACHSARAGAPFAGGYAVPTPFGAIPAPNITPDTLTGLGQWTFTDFWRALHAGKGRHGELLYPAFPFPAYTRVTRDDALAMFAYLQSLAPVRRRNSQARLRFPFGIRSGLALWRALYFHEGIYRPDRDASSEWNRGAYLVQGLGHCKECHARRNGLGGLRDGPRLSGGTMPGQDWYAPDLGMREGGGLQGWRRQDLIDLLKTGQSARGTAFGPMADVVMGSTQHMTDADLAAVATYLESLPAHPRSLPTAATTDTPARLRQGAAIYDHRCAACHGKDGEGIAGVYPALAGNVAVDEPTGMNATRVVLLGGFAPLTAANPRPYSMPPFAQVLSDEEVSAVVSYIRQRWGNRAAPVAAHDVGRYRQTPVD